MRTAVSATPAAHVFHDMAATLRAVDRQPRIETALRHEETESRLRYVHWFEARWMAELFIIDLVREEELCAKFGRPWCVIWKHIRRVTGMPPRVARVRYARHGWDFASPEPTTRRPGRRPASQHGKRKI